MERRTLELNLISARDLKDVNLFSKMDVYAVVSLSDDQISKQKAKTTIDRDCGPNPNWNFPMKFTIDESLAKQNRLTLVIKLKTERNLGTDKDIGEVNVPVKELLDSIGDGKSLQFVSYQVRKPSGKPQGALNISYKFGEKIAAPVAAPVPTVPKGEPVTAYPAAPGVGSSSSSYGAPYPPPAGYGYPPQPPPQGTGYGYPPPQPGYGYPPRQPGYGYPPQPGYGHPPQPGYGYPPVQKPAKKNKLGMGLGAGLLGGALGGLLIGDALSDAGSYDSGYDAGFDDAGGFDF
ncbi:Protein SRC2 [Quillaja saponaria]|uniref:Protein SRC2 n=1 Tax=Quillaja saponaria TaxID=32244 RepID=A0AAD7PHH1_QUISA|nr:Protein SRC2 [Quillaja saponaria]